MGETKRDFAKRTQWPEVGLPKQILKFPPTPIFSTRVRGAMEWKLGSCRIGAKERAFGDVMRQLWRTVDVRTA
jgi:hypothetical protein